MNFLGTATVIASLTTPAPEGATQLSPARERWDRMQKQDERRRCGRFCFASTTSKS